MNISLPETLKTFVDKQVEQRGYGTSSEYMRDLIRKDQQRTHLRALLLKGAASRASSPANDAYFDGLGDRVRQTSRAVKHEQVVLRALADRDIRQAIDYYLGVDERVAVEGC